MKKYSITLQWSDEDGGFIATVPEFPGFSAFGETEESAVKEAKIALEGFIEVYEEDGIPLPEPDVVHEYSGQTRLRLPKSLHRELSQQAKREGVSLNLYINSLLSERNAYQKTAHLINSLQPPVININVVKSSEEQELEPQKNIFEYGDTNMDLTQ